MGLASPNSRQRTCSRYSAECRASNSNTRQHNTTTYTGSQPFGTATDNEVRHETVYGGYFGSDNKGSFPPVSYNRDGGVNPFGARDDAAV